MCLPVVKSKWIMASFMNCVVHSASFVTISIVHFPSVQIAMNCRCWAGFPKWIIAHTTALCEPNAEWNATKKKRGHEERNLQRRITWYQSMVVIVPASWSSSHRDTRTKARAKVSGNNIIQTRAHQWKRGKRIQVVSANRTNGHTFAAEWCLKCTFKG